MKECIYLFFWILLGGVTAQENCFITSDLKTAQYALKMDGPFDNRTKDDVVKKISEIYTGMDLMQLKELKEKDIYNLISMIHFFENQSVPDWSSLNFPQLRMKIERMVIKKQKTVISKQYFETLIGLMDTQEVLLLACNHEEDLGETTDLGFPGGCYRSLFAELPVTVRNGSIEDCLLSCRSRGYFFVAIHETTCACAKKPSSLGDKTEDEDTCKNGIHIWKTGIGNPIVLSPDPRQDANFKLSKVFDPLSIDGVDLNSNHFIGAKQVVHPEEVDEVYIVAVYSYCVVLFKIKRSAKGEEFYEYIGHKRWDGENYIMGSDSWIMQFEQDDQIFAPPEMKNASLGEVSAFDVIPVFITVNDTMDTDYPVDFENPGSIQNLTNFAGLPIPGGRFYYHIVLFHKDNLFFYSKPPVQTTIIRLEERGLHQLMNARSDDAFGSFIANDSPDKFPVSVSKRMIGRRSFLFVASNNVLMKANTSKVAIYEMMEEYVPVTAYAGYGRVVMEERNSIEIDIVDDIEVAENLHNFLILLDHTVENLSRVHIFVIKNFFDLDKVDEMQLNERYDSVAFAKMQGEGHVVLSSSKKSIVIPVTRKGKLAEIKLVFNETFTVPLVYGALENDLIFPSMQKQNPPVFKTYDDHGFELPIAMNVNYEEADQNLFCYPSNGSSVCLVFSKDQVSFDILRIPSYHKVNVDNSLLKQSEWETLKHIIDMKVSYLDNVYRLQSMQKSELLMKSENSISGSWSFNSITVSKKLRIDDNSLNKTKINFSLKSGEKLVPLNVNGHSDYHQGIKVKLEEVSKRLGEIDTSLEDLEEMMNKTLSISTNDPQFIKSIHLNTLSSEILDFKGATLNFEYLGPKDEQESVMSLENDLVLKGHPVFLRDCKTFANKLQSQSLQTNFLSDRFSTLSPKSCLLVDGNQSIPMHITLYSPTDISNLYMKTSQPLKTSVGEKSVLLDDLQIKESIGGFLNFKDQVSAASVNANLAADNFDLNIGDQQRILKNNEPGYINGTLEINLDDGNTAVGMYINVKNGIVNEINLMELADNVVFIDCKSCAEMVVNLNEMINFTGEVRALNGINAEKINYANFDDYVKKEMFSDDNHVILGEKIIHSNCKAHTVMAEEFNKHRLKSLMTRTTEQTIGGHTTFKDQVVFDAIESSDTVPPKIDNLDFMKTFRSNLLSIQEDKDWMKKSDIESNVVFSELVIGPDAKMEIAGNINSIHLPDVMDNLVLNSEDEIEFLQSNIFEPDVKMKYVKCESIIKGDQTYSMSSFANTKDTSMISGEKVFAGNLTVQDIFLVGMSRINNEDFSKILQCWVDVGSNDTRSIDIFHPLKFEKVVAPNFILAKNINSSTCSPPLSDILEDIAHFIGLEPTIDSSKMQSLELKKTMSDLMSTKYQVLLNEDDDEFALNAMLTYTLIVKGKTFLQNNMKMKEKREALNRIIRSTYKFSSERASALTDLEAVQLLCRDPVINRFNPAKDLALLDKDNVFCSVNESCIQKFSQGFSSAALNVGENIHMNKNDTIFNVDLSALENERASLTGYNLMEGNYLFNQLSMESTGSFTGQLLIDHKNLTVSSSNYKAKFLDVQSDELQAFTACKNISTLKADLIRAKLFKVSEAEYDLPTLLKKSHMLNESLYLSNLVFNDRVMVDSNIKVSGTVDGVNIRKLAQDLLINGNDKVIDEGLTISGSNRPFLDISGEKIFLSGAEIGVLEAMMDGGVLYPNFLFLPCTVGKTVTGRLVSEPTDVVIKFQSLEECHEECRIHACRAISYSESTNECRVFKSYKSLIPTESEFTSYIYECWMQLQSSISSSFLAVDKETKRIITLQEPDGWFFQDDRLINQATRLAVTIPNGAKIGDEPILSLIDVSNENQLFSYTEGSKFKIKSKSHELWLTESESRRLVLDDVGTEWIAGMGGVKLDRLVNGVPSSRLLTRNTAQAVTAPIVIKGATNINGVIKSDTLEEISAKQIASLYEFNSVDDVHEVKGDYQVGGKLDIDDLHTDSINGVDFNEFIKDVINKTSSEIQTITGTKVFRDLDVRGVELKVKGTVSGYNLDEEHAKTAFIDSDARLNFFTQPSTFIQDGNNSVTVVGRMKAMTELTLENPEIQDGVNLAKLHKSSIPRDLDEPVYVPGTVVFRKDVLSDSDVEFGSVSGETGDAVELEDLVLNTDERLNLTVDGVNRKFSKVNVKDLHVAGQLFGHKPEEFLDIVYKDGEQTIFGPAKFTRKTTVQKDAKISGTFNGYKLPVSVVLLSENITLLGHFEFSSSLSIQSLLVDGRIDELDFDKMAMSIFTADGNQTISEKWHFKSPTTFEQKILGESESGDELINHQKVSDLKAVDNIYEKLQAVKISAQAEAATLCDYVDDLQLSYLSNQGIKKYELFASRRLAGADLTDSLLFKFSTSRIGLLAINGSQVNFWRIDDDLEPFKTLDLQETNPVRLKIEGSLLLSHSEDPDLYDQVIFISTGRASAGTIIIRIVESAGEILVEKAGILSEVDSIAILDHDKVFTLDFMEADSVYVSRIKIMDLSSLRECGLNCSAVALTPVWTGDVSEGWTTFQENFEPRLDAVYYQDTEHFTLAMSESRDGLAQKIARVIHIEPGLKEGLHSYTVHSLIVVESNDFTLLNVNSKTYLLSANQFLQAVSVDMNDIAVSYPIIQQEGGVLSYLHRHHNFNGKSDLISVVKDGESVLFLEYAGTKGLTVTREIKSDDFISSSSSVIWSEDGETKNFLVYAGGEKITLLHAILKNPTSMIQIRCPRPEISDILKDPTTK